MKQLRSDAEIDVEVRRLVYDRFIIQASAVPRDEIARELELTEQQVATSLRRLAEAHMLVLQPVSGQVLMANPFSAVPTAFRVVSGEKRWWGNCIWDALGILAMTGRDGAVQTSCPDCGEALRCAVAGGELVEAEGVVHFAVPANRWWEDIVYT